MNKMFYTVRVDESDSELAGGNMPKVTIVVPVYNVEKYLSRCLDSIMAQTYKDYEVICIDDCSLDSSKEIMESYAECEPDKIKALYNEKNIGPGKTKERGMRIAKGEYILFIDSDDYIKRDYVATYLEAMQTHTCDVVIGGYIRDMEGKRYRVHKAKNSDWSLLTYPIVCAKMFRKDFLIKNNLEFSKLRCGEDTFFSLCAFSCGASYHVIDYAGYYYYFNQKSITGSMNYEKKFERIISQVFDEYFEWFDISKLSEKDYRMLEYTYITNMVNALITYGHGGRIKRMRDKYDFFMSDVRKKFPDYASNKYYGLFRPKGQTTKIRFGVGLVMLLHKIHLDKLFFYFISLI